MLTEQRHLAILDELQLSGRVLARELDGVFAGADSDTFLDDWFGPDQLAWKQRMRREQANRRHLLEGKSSHVTRRMTGTVVVAKADTPRVKKMLGR